MITRKFYPLLLGLILMHSALVGQCLVFPPYGHSYGIRKATQAHLFLFLPFARFDDPQGLATVKMDSRDDSSTTRDDDEVVVYGVNSGRHQLIYNTSMWGLSIYGKEGNGVERFKYPKGIACDPHGNVYVVDAGNNRIVHLFNPQRTVSWVNAFSGNEHGGVGLSAPSQISLDETGMLYVTDTGNRRIVVFDSTGRVETTIDTKNGCNFMNGPTTIAVADGMVRWSSFRNERAIFCADKNGTRLWKMSLSGNVEKIVFMPKGYRAFYGAVDYYHNFYVTDKDNHCILKFDHSLQLLDIFGSFGKDDNQFIEPRGIAIWKRFGQVFVAEQEGAQYFWVGTGAKQIGCWKSSTTNTPAQYTLRTNLTEYGYVSLLGIRGVDTIEIVRSRFVQPGDRQCTFVSKELQATETTKYLCRIEPTYSSYTYYQWDYPTKVYSDSASVPVKLPQGVMVTKKGDKGDSEKEDRERKPKRKK